MNLNKTSIRGAAASFGITYLLVIFLSVFIMKAPIPISYVVADSGSNSGGKITTLVIDPGHGGPDGGAAAKDGTQEKNINLAIALNLRDIASKYPINIIMTREQDVGLYGENCTSWDKRQDLIERKKIMKKAVENASAKGEEVLAVTIHLNSFPQDSSVCGSQLFYPKKENNHQMDTEREMTSKDFAQSVQNSVENKVETRKHRNILPKGDILLFEKPPCKIILAECGFLSNENEAELLKTGEYQQKIAEALWEGINAKLCLSVKKKPPIIQSTNKGEKT